MSKPQYPIGPLQLPAIIDKVAISEALKILKDFPEALKSLTQNLPNEALERPYREGSWTIRQLVHHISDSHNHAYNRIRWTLTEDSPLIKAYNQDGYAQMEDYHTMPIAWSVLQIEVLHHKLLCIFETLHPEDWKKYFVHPETNKKVTVAEMALTYAWHSKHHLAHIKNGLG